MIIWSRWGFLVFLLVGAGVGTGWLLSRVFVPDVDGGPQVGMFIGIGLMASGLYVLALDRLLIKPHLDKPQPIFVMAPFPQPWVDDQGRTNTHHRVPAVNQQTGEQLFTRPRSSLFFIPVAAWVFVLPAFGLVVFVITAVSVLAS